MCVCVCVCVCMRACVCVRACVCESSHPPLHQLTCLGAIGHRLTVKAMDDVYDRTKKLMREAEEKSKKAR